MSGYNDRAIVESWQKNATPWTEAVRRREIQSRRLVTDRAIVDAVCSRSPRSVLDMGCGEGWLARELAARAIHVTGVDVVPGLIEQAQRAGGGEFRVASYEEIAAGALDRPVDAVVCNFSLIGNESVNGLFAAVPALLNPGGAFLVQTLHPRVACGDLPYEDGWRSGSWEGFSPEFVDPAPWYFRTLESWERLFSQHGMSVIEVSEPIHPHTQLPASVIFMAEAASPGCTPAR